MTVKFTRLDTLNIEPFQIDFMEYYFQDNDTGALTYTSATESVELEQNQYTERSK